MNEQAKLMEQIEELVVNDYVNPGIRTEVIFDCLLTPYIAGILEEQLDRKADSLTLLAKEMPIKKPKDSDGKNNPTEKADAGDNWGSSLKLKRGG